MIEPQQSNLTTGIAESPAIVLIKPAEPPAESGPADGFRKYFRSVLNKAGIDRAIGYTVLGRGWSIFAGPLTLLLITRFLRPDEQGFYYTFGSVIALNVFFELGLGYVLLQFASHEKASLDWNSARTLSGDEVARVRLAGLLKLAMRWYGVAAFLVIMIVLPAGLFFFARNSVGISAVSWRAPWAWLVIASAADLLAAPLFAILEGCGRVAQLASMRMKQTMLANLGLWLTLLCHGGLFAGPVLQTLNVAFEMGWLVVFYRQFFVDMFRIDTSKARFPWRSEVWPFQWRIALSWLSGYFIFQLFNPVLFASRGPVVAGQMGMSISICSALLSVAMAWMSTKASPFGVLVVRKQWLALDAIFFRTLGQSLIVLIAGAMAGYIGVLVLNHGHYSLAKRLLGPLPFALLLLATVINHIVFCEAQYLRAHKAEPFLLLSVLVGICTAASTLTLAKPFGALGVSAGYLICCSIAFIVGTKIFLRRRQLWHR